MDFYLMEIGQMGSKQKNNKVYGVKTKKVISQGRLSNQPFILGATITIWPPHAFL